MMTASAEKRARLSKRKAEGAAENGVSSARRGRSSEEALQSSEGRVEFDEVEAAEVSGSAEKKRNDVLAKKLKEKGEGSEDEDCCFLGDSIPDAEAKQRWPERYMKKASITRKGDDDSLVRARCHYLKARVDGYTYKLYDDAYIKAGEGEPDYIGRIIEFFEASDKQLYFTAQWFFRAEDTVIKEHAHFHDARRVFLSEEKNDNVLDCLVSKIRIVQVSPNVDFSAKEEGIPTCDLYYNNSYSIAYSTFASLPYEGGRAGSEMSSTISSEDVPDASESKLQADTEASTSGEKSELSLLDMYCGCGAMSTGLCYGANLAGMTLKTLWAVDVNPYACQSLKLNHPETEVRNEHAEDFLALLREWDGLCKRFGLASENAPSPDVDSSDDEESDGQSKLPDGVFEVAKIVGICYGKTDNLEKVGLKFKVRWEGYGSKDDTWEPIDGLSGCQERIENFVRRGFRKNILPLPGTVDVLCGGPPCQGISGFNRFRNFKAPLDDPKNQQMLVFMDIVDFLKPQYVLMENVVDILKFAGGFLGRYALSRLVSMNYQAKMGIMAAGAYGLPQFRMRVFLWGARPHKSLPQFPLPTHDAVVRGCAPNEFEQNIVTLDENQQSQVEKALLLCDAISDLPPIENNEMREEMAYEGPPKTEFQRFIRLSQEELLNPSSMGEMSSQMGKLFDHQPLQLNEDDFLRVCQIPKRKGANFRDLPGVRVGPNNVIEWDPNVERVLLPSGKPLIPDYAMSYINGKSLKPFARLWWDETIPTVVTRAEPHNQAILHPEQDRVLSIRENARLQGFMDFYKLCGPVKERYIQVGNAVAVPVSRALGFALGQAFQGKGSSEPLFSLPPRFPQHNRTGEIIE